jgi:acetolactate synthase-1/3 small subunit
MINRVAGVFARRGANIESLAVGLCEDKALFTIVATGTDNTIGNLSKQIAKLVNVRYVEDITDIEHIERELVLVKVKTPPGEGIAELRNLAEIFRARILDVGTTSCTLMLTGDTGKAAAFKHNVSKFGILEFSRTGRIAINRGEYLFDPMSRYEGAEVTDSSGKSIKVQAGKHEMGVYSMSSLNSMDADDILLGGESGKSKDVLGATYAEGTSRGVLAKRAEKILSLNVEDVPGVLNEVTGVIARRGFNIRSLAVGNSETPGMSRITIAVPVGESNIQNLIKQLYKLIHVDSIEEIENKPHVERELMMIKVACNTVQRGEVFNIARIFRGSVCDISRSTVTIEIAGKEKKLRALQEILEPYGILEVARTGILVSLRDAGVDSSYLDSLSGFGRV